MTAIYARQSADRTDSISIESQIEFCRYETRGEAVRVYTDRGYSGKNIDRPAFAEMISDMENGLVTKIVVYKLDRISRSILDFSAMMEKLERHHTEFVSTTEKFDTASPMGRAMLNICVVFAQLERETIQKRVADAYFSRSRKSFYMGGRVPYGFRLAPAEIGGIKTAMYVICPEEAEQIRLIYELYARPQCSYGDIIRYFNGQGILKNGRPWGRTRFAELLRNPIYVRADRSVYEFYRDQGAVLVNEPSDFIGTNGCYCYKGKSAQSADSLVLALHEGIVPAKLWLKCREKCLRTPQSRPSQKAKNSWLAGKIKCARCGYALVDKHNAARKSRYFLCSNRINAKACIGPGTVYAQEVEQLVGEEIQKKLAQFEPLRKRREEPDSPKLGRLQLELLQTEVEIAALVNRLAAADDVLSRYISGRVGELDAKKQTLGKQISALRQRQETDSAEIHHPGSCWEELGFEDKREIVDQLIGVIRVAGDRIQIEWRI